MTPETYSPPTVLHRSHRIRWLLIGGALLIALAAFYVHYYLYHPIGAGPAGPPVPREPFEQVWTTQKILLVGMGDSVTAGLGSTRGHSYFERLVANPPDEFEEMQGRSLSRIFPNLKTLNIALSGSNSAQHVEHIQTRLPQQDADTFGLVVITSGGNDLIHWYGRTAPAENAMYGATWDQAQPWIANYEQRLDEMLSAIKSKFPAGCVILLADIYDPSDGYGDPESAGLPSWPDVLRIHAAYNDALRRAAARHAEAHVVPMHDEFLGHGVHCRKFWLPIYRPHDPHYWYAPNIEDPHDRGYDAIRRLFLLELIKLQNQFRGM